MANPLLSLTLADSYGRQTTKIVEMRDMLLHVDQVAEAVQYIADLEDVTDLGVVRADIIYRGVSEGFDPQAGANVDTGATFTGYLLAGNGKKGSVKVPGIKPALVSADGTIQITGVVATFLENYEESDNLFMSDGEQVESWISGRLDK